MSGESGETKSEPAADAQAPEPADQELEASESAAQGPEPDGDAPEGDALEAAWAVVEADWATPEAHKKYLVLADTLDRLAEAGRRYRAVKERDPTRRDEADKRIDDLLGLAMKRVRLDKVEPQKTRSRVEWIALGISIVLISAALFSAMRMIGN